MRLATIWLVTLFLATLAAGPAESTLRYMPQQTQDGLGYLVVSGDFDHQESIEAFVSAARASSATFIAFDSPGGNVYAAMALGRAIRALGLNTLQIRQMECASACALAFLGGVQRIAAPGSIGVHRASFQPGTALDRDQAVAGVQEITADVLAYLKEMGVSQDLLTFALRYDSSDMRYLSASEMQVLNVVTTGSPSPSRSVDPPQVPESKMTAEQAAIAIVRMLVESDSQASLDIVRKWYGPMVAYYGKTVGLAEVIADKQRYFSRWPQRHYRIRDRSLESFCTGEFCQVSGEYDYEVKSNQRKKASSGVARFTYTISRGSAPKVIGEAGFVLN